jgi:DNA topoisomerase IB
MGRLRRIDCTMRALAIPPGREDVWICADWPEVQGPIEEAVLDLIDRRESRR